MTQLKFIALSFSICALCFFSCQNSGVLVDTNDTLTTIPADASMVTSIDVNSLLTKMDFEATKKMEFYQDALREVRQESELIAKIMENPSASGIDLTKNIYLAYDVDSKVIGNVFAYATASIKDQAAFEALLKENNLGEFQVKEGYKISKPARRQIAAWSDEMVVVGFSVSSMDIEKSVAEIFTTDKENSIATDSHFQKAIKGKHDISTWYSSNAIADNTDAQLAVGMMNIKASALKDNYTYGHLDFNKGQIQGQSTFDINKDLSRELDLFFKDQPSVDLTQSVPTENLGFGMTAALDLKGINQVLSERPQAKSFVNFALREYGLTLEQILNALGGDLILTGYGDETAGGLGLFATTIGDRAELDKLLATGEEFGFLTKNGAYYTVGNGGIPFLRIPGNASIMIHKDLIYAASNVDMLENVKNGTGGNSKMSKKIKQLSKSNIFSLLTDAKAFQGMDFPSFGAGLMELTTNRKNADIKMEFEDKNTNSLQQIMEGVNAAYLEQAKRKGTSM